MQIPSSWEKCLWYESLLVYIMYNSICTHVRINQYYVIALPHHLQIIYQTAQSTPPPRNVDVTPFHHTSPLWPKLFVLFFFSQMKFRSWGWIESYVCIVFFFVFVYQKFNPILMEMNGKSITSESNNGHSFTIIFIILFILFVCYCLCNKCS